MTVCILLSRRSRSTKIGVKRVRVNISLHYVPPPFVKKIISRPQKVKYCRIYCRQIQKKHGKGSAMLLFFVCDYSIARAVLVEQHAARQYQSYPCRSRSLLRDWKQTRTLADTGADWNNPVRGLRLVRGEIHRPQRAGSCATAAISARYGIV